MNERSKMLNSHEIKSLLIKLSIPATLAMMVNALYNLMDTLYVSAAEGELAIGALAIAFPVQSIVMAIALMIGIGAASVFSRAFGRGDKNMMVQSVNTALRIGFIISLVTALLVRIFISDILYVIGADSDNFDFAYDYLSVVLIGFVPLTLSVALNNLTRAEGRAMLAMTAMILGAGLNIILDPIFIFDGFTIPFTEIYIPLLGLGVGGAALATVISQITAFIFLFTKSFSKESNLNITLKGLFTYDVNALLEIVLVGLPTFVRNSVGALLAILIYNVIGYYILEPAIYISIYGVINRIIFFVFMPAFGIVQGLAPICGYNFGAKNYKRVKEVVTFANFLLLLYFVGGFLFIQILSPQIFDLFSKSNDQFFITTGASIFRTISIGFVIIGYQIILGSIYQSFGYPLRALFVSTSRQIIFFLPVVFIFTHFFGLNGLWYTFIFADVLAGTMSYFMLKHEMNVLELKIA